MVNIIIMMVFFCLVSLGVFLISFTNFLGNRELSSPFECGFDIKNYARRPFSLRFFLILLLFLIFDVEIILVLQFPFFLGGGKVFSFFYLIIFMIVLFIATVEEWRRGFLN